MLNRSKHSIIGIPDHQGVVNVGGRIGARHGPEAFRFYFGKLQGRECWKDKIIDLGDVQQLGSLVEDNHHLAAMQVREMTQQGGISVVIGGGHDHAYSHLRGIYDALYKKKKLRLGCINLDAHLDLRKPNPEITSGSPFYLAIESKILDPSRLIEFGIQSHCNRPDLWTYAEKKKIKIIPFQKLRKGKAVQLFNTHLNALARICDVVVISFDLDSVTSSDAPGVSAPQAEGFSSSEVIEMMEIAGKNKKVISLGIFELNPDYDQDGKTARLAATCAFHFFEAALKLN